MWKTKFQNLSAKFQFQLGVRQRTKLIEILLIVGSIVAAFKIPTRMVWLFMFFALFAILYYILIQKENDFSPLLSLSSLLVSASFVGIVIFNMASSLISTYLKDIVITFRFVLGAILGFVLCIYYVFFTYVIYRALRPPNQSLLSIFYKIKMNILRFMGR